MDKKIVKQAYKEAEDSLKEKQVAEVKQIVLKTLEKLDGLKKQKEVIKAQEKGVDKKIKVLKMDIDDLKEGRLDRISERQEKDEEAKNTSVVVIIREKVTEIVNPWFVPYQVVWQYEPYQMPAPSCLTVGDTTNDAYHPSCTTLVDDGSFLGSPGAEITLTNSSSKYGAAGAYTVGDAIIHLR